ncbi:MAG: deoxyuridine 5'-triphosphate nucleotidohydrolase [Bacteroidetes bacterium RIFCSPLOWO2_02_FULL_36_8]|nr:MAG: deoxyuridine 5'-triphosphate nucleotidohydrolase [Bacteroidetes bacterium RIFCSPLOWO2_02_FULL_36_8]OFY68742.1 MAG: deoxyuridine 5'-triphosphate nucleotidohydrolase [Bacteroidetes bacterium RIFCSPLOWO2_12_FULL_37_12]
MHHTPLKVKVINRSPNPLPEYQTQDSAGLDLRAWCENDVLLKAGEKILVGTGLYIEMPSNCEGQVRPRSGLALKHGVTVLNSPGTIDPDYRGEIKVLLINHSSEDFIIHNGERIAQMIFSSFNKIEWVESGELQHSQRMQGGYGHTGVV